MPGVAVDPAAVEAVVDDVAGDAGERPGLRGRRGRPASSAAWLANASRAGAAQAPLSCRVPCAAGELPRDVARLLRCRSAGTSPPRPAPRTDRACAVTRSFGLALSARPSSGSDAVRAVERREVVVEREHEAQPLDRPLVAAQVDVVASPRRLGEQQLAVDDHRPADDVRRRTRAAPAADAAARLGHTGVTIDVHRLRSMEAVTETARPGRVLARAQRRSARRARVGARVRRERRAPRGGRVGRARGDAVAADPGGGEDRPVLVRGARAVLRGRDRAAAPDRQRGALLGRRGHRHVDHGHDARGRGDLLERHGRAVRRVGAAVLRHAG